MRPDRYRGSRRSTATRAVCRIYDRRVGGVPFLSASELLAGYRSRSFTPSEAVDAFARQIEVCEPQLKAFLTLTLDAAATAAEDADRRWAVGTARALEGVPFAAKDLFDTAGVLTTCGSSILGARVPAADAAAVKRAKDAGAILVGKTSTHEFAWGITGYNRHFDSGRNPWNAAYVTGGSSGGSAAAVAAGEVPLALGTDTGGSIRIPSAFCGVFGLKPTFGRVSTEGVFPLAPSLDTVGPIARTPEDLSLFLAVLAGSAPPAAPDGGLRGLRVGLCADLMPVEPTPAVREALDRVVATLVELGAKQVEVGLAGAAEIRGVFTEVQRAEAVRTHREAGLWPARKAEYGADVALRLEGAETATWAGYIAAIEARENVRGRFADTLTEVDVLVTPVSPSDPVLLGSEEREHLGETVAFRDLVLPLTTPQNLVGVPACAVRAGFSELGLPIGVQLTGRAGTEATLLEAAAAFYDATPEIQRRHPVFA
jgi:aspartyl-tRNA(Asn)/glutamyl-tRNA(Gln) amidotransferase subunit A